MKKIWWLLKGFVLCLLVCCSYAGIEAKMAFDGETFDHLIKGDMRFKKIRIVEHEEDDYPEEVQDKAPIGFY